jgi:hypothetical protein
VNVHNSFTLNRTVTADEVDLRVLGDNQNLNVTLPINATKSVQYVVPDGTLTLPSGRQITTPTAVIKARSMVVPSNRLDLSADKLTLINRPDATTPIEVVNTRGLHLTNRTSADHLAPIDVSIANLFPGIPGGIKWVGSASEAWRNQVFDTNMNPVAMAIGGNITVRLPAQTTAQESAVNDALLIDARVRSYLGNVTLIADKMDFTGGAGTIQGPGTATLQAATAAWTYRLGTAAEIPTGAKVDPNLAPRSLDLSADDMAALADGFTQIIVGRTGAGNEIRLGDLFDMTKVKATGDARVVNASLKDQVRMIGDRFIIQGDVRRTTR